MNGKERETCNPRDPNRVIVRRQGDRDLFRFKSLNSPLNLRVSVWQVNGIAMVSLVIKRNRYWLEWSLKGR